MTAFDPLEDRIDVLHEDLGRVRAELGTAERAVLEGRVTDVDANDERVGRLRARLAGLERELAGEYAARIAACECDGFECGYCGGAA